MTDNEVYHIQVGKGKGSYQTRYSVKGWNRAVFWYNGLNTHSGHKKRLIDCNGEVLARVIT